MSESNQSKNQQIIEKSEITGNKNNNSDMPIYKVPTPAKRTTTTVAKVQTAAIGSRKVDRVIFLKDDNIQFVKPCLPPQPSPRNTNRTSFTKVLEQFCNKKISNNLSNIFLNILSELHQPIVLFKHTFPRKTVVIIIASSLEVQ